VKGNTMIVKWSNQRNPFKNVDPLLIPRAMQQLGAGAEEFGIRPVSSVPGGIRIDTRNVPNLAALQTWLTAVDAVLVTAEPSDLKVLAGGKMSPEVVGMSRSWPTERFTDLLPEELAPAMRQSYFDSYTGDDGPDGSDIGLAAQEDIANDLRKAGLDVPAGNRLEQWEEFNRDKPREVNPEFLQQFTETDPFQMEDNYGANL
jgi:hypothetical protein